MQIIKKVAITAAIAAIAIITSGLISWLTADGHAAIGPDPVSLAAQRQTILWQTFWWSLTSLGVALVSWLIVKRQSRSNSVGI